MATDDPTAARDACWDAVLNWSALQAGGMSIFKRKYRFSDDDSPEVNPTKEQLPAIALFPTPGESLANDVLNRVHQFDYKLTFMVFSETWNLETHDDYWQQIIKALFQSALADVPYVKAATGFYPREAFAIGVERIKLKETKALLTTISFMLRIRFDPRN